MPRAFDNRSSSRGDLGIMDHEVMRGRKRDRSTTRTPAKTMGPDESSTLRGRSRRRATSPFGYASRNTSPSLTSPTRQRLLYDRLRATRREHCPSRPVSPSGRSRLRRRQRTRSRTREPRMEPDVPRFLESFSSLRHEVIVDEDSNEDITNEEAGRQ